MEIWLMIERFSFSCTSWGRVLSSMVPNNMPRVKLWIILRKI